MNSSLPNAARRLSGERPPGEMPSIDPDSMESDATFAAIISRDDTGKLTVGHRESRRPKDSTPTVPESGQEEFVGDGPGDPGQKS